MIVLIIFSVALLSNGLGFVVGKYNERKKWNELIEEGIIPRPSKA